MAPRSFRLAQKHLSANHSHHVLGMEYWERFNLNHEKDTSIDRYKTKVTKLAKWKTATQMIAITCLFAQGVFEHYMGAGTAGEVLSGWAGLVLLWIAGGLTAVTGVDYFLKARRYLKD